MEEIVTRWLDTVSYSHSGSKGTNASYTTGLTSFLEYCGMNADQIVSDYEASDDRTFKRKYAQKIMGFIGVMRRKGYSAGSVTAKVYAVRSFFKYNDLPVGFIPSGKNLIEFHNRDIQKDEIVQILALSGVREKAVFCVLTQSGLRPDTVANLKVGDVEGILEEETPIPAKITVRQENTKGKFQGYWSFVGRESIEAIKDYLKTRGKIDAKSYLFTAQGVDDKPLSAGVETHLFRRILEKLSSKNILSIETTRKDMKIEDKDKKLLRDHITRNDLRLYCLRKYFRRVAGDAGAEYVNFWMGHTSALGVDLHYFSRDVEVHRKQYAEKAMPNLRLENATPTETEKQISELAGQVEKLRELVRVVSNENTDLRQRLEARTFIHSGENFAEDMKKEIQALRAEVAEIKKKRA
jgi:site-specific recombinase XerD